MQIFLITLILLISIYAYKKEVDEQPNIYKHSILEEGDNLKKLFKKLQDCLLVDSRSIKWRRSFISAVLITALMFGLIHYRIPSSKEIILTILLIYVIFYSSWINYTNVISDKVFINGNNIIRKLKVVKTF